MTTTDLPELSGGGTPTVPIPPAQPVPTSAPVDVPDSDIMNAGSTAFQEPANSNEAEQYWIGNKERANENVDRMDREFALQQDAAQSQMAAQAVQEQQQAVEAAWKELASMSDAFTSNGVDFYQFVENREAAEDQLATFAAEKGQLVDPQAIAEVQQRYQELAGTAVPMSQDLQRIRKLAWELEPRTRLNKDTPWLQEGLDRLGAAAGSALNTASLGYLGTEGTRKDKAIQSLLDEINVMAEERYSGPQPNPMTQASPSGNTLDMSFMDGGGRGMVGAMPKDPPPPIDKEAYKRLLLRHVMGEGGLAQVFQDPDGWETFANMAATTLGIVVPLGPVMKAGSLVGKGAAKLSMTPVKAMKNIWPGAVKVAAGVEWGAGYLGASYALYEMGYATEIPMAAQAQIDMVASPEERVQLEEAFRFQAGVMLGAFAPLWGLAGIGGRAGGALATKFGTTAAAKAALDLGIKTQGAEVAAIVKMLGASAGSAFVFPMIGEVSEGFGGNLMEYLATDDQGIQMAIDMGMIGKGDWRTPGIQALQAIGEGDIEAFVENTGDYLSHAAPGVASFAMHGIGSQALREGVGRGLMNSVEARKMLKGFRTKAEKEVEMLDGEQLVKDQMLESLRMQDRMFEETAKPEIKSEREMLREEQGEGSDLAVEQEIAVRNIRGEPKENGPRTVEGELQQVDKELAELRDKAEVNAEEFGVADSETAREIDSLEKVRQRLQDESTGMSDEVSPEGRLAARERAEGVRPTTEELERTASEIREFHETGEAATSEKSALIGDAAEAYGLAKPGEVDRARIADEFTRSLKDKFEDGDSIRFGETSYEIVRNHGDAVELRDPAGNTSVWSPRQILEAGVQNAGLSSHGKMPQRPESSVPSDTVAAEPTAEVEPFRKRLGGAFAPNPHDPLVQKAVKSGTTADAEIGGKQGKAYVEQQAEMQRLIKDKGMTEDDANLEATFQIVRRRMGRPKDTQETPALPADGTLVERLDAGLESLRHVEEMVRVEGSLQPLWDFRLAAEALFEGAESIVGDRTLQGRKFQERVARLEAEQFAQSGVVDVGMLAAPFRLAGKLARGFVFGQMADYMKLEQSRDPSIKPVAGLDAMWAGLRMSVLRHTIGPTAFAGWVGRSAMQLTESVRYDITTMNDIMFRAKDGLFKGVKSDDPNDVMLWEMQEQGPKSKVWEDAPPEMQSKARDLRKWYKDMRDAIVAIHPWTRMLASELAFYGENVKSLAEDVAKLKDQLPTVQQFEQGHRTSVELRDIVTQLRDFKARSRKYKKDEAPPDITAKIAELTDRQTAIHSERNLSSIERFGKSSREIRQEMDMLEAELQSERGRLEATTANREAFMEEWGIENYINHIMIDDVRLSKRDIFRPMERASGVIPGGHLEARGITRIRDARKGPGELQTRAGVRRVQASLAMERKEVPAKYLRRSAMESTWKYIGEASQYLRRSEFMANTDDFMHGTPTPLTETDVLRGNSSVIFNSSEFRLFGAGVATREKGRITGFKRRAGFTPEQEVEYGGRRKELEARRKASGDRGELTEAKDLEMQVDAEHIVRAGEREARALALAKRKTGVDRSKEAQEVVMLFRGSSNTPLRLDDPAWFKANHMNIEVVPVRVARRLIRTWKDGWYGKALQMKDQGGEWSLKRMEEFIEKDFLGGIQDLAEGTHGKSLSDFMKKTDKGFAAVANAMVSVKVGGNVRSAVTAVTGGLLTHFFATGGLPSIPSIRARGRLWKAEHEVTTYHEGQIKVSKGDPKNGVWADLNAGVWDRLKTPESKLAAMTPEKRKDREFEDEALEFLVRTGIFGGNAGDRAREDVNEFQKRFGAINRSSAKQLGTWVKKARDGWWFAFNQAEQTARAVPFVDTYVKARRANPTSPKQEAVNEAFQIVQQIQMYFNKASKSRWGNHPLGRLFSNLGTWTIHNSGRVVQSGGGAERVGAQAKMVLKMGSAVAVAQALGFDMMNMLGSKVGDWPGVGDAIVKSIFGIGEQTDDDSTGRQPKGALWDAGWSDMFVPVPINPYIAALGGEGGPVGNLVWDTGLMVSAYLSKDYDKGDYYKSKVYKDLTPTIVKQIMSAVDPEETIVGGNRRSIAGKGGNTFMEQLATAEGTDAMAIAKRFAGDSLHSRARPRMYDIAQLEMLGREHENNIQKQRATAGDLYGAAMVQLMSDERAGGDGAASASQARQHLGRWKELQGKLGQDVPQGMELRRQQYAMIKRKYLDSKLDSDQLSMVFGGTRPSVEALSTYLGQTDGIGFRPLSESQYNMLLIKIFGGDGVSMDMTKKIRKVGGIQEEAEVVKLWARHARQKMDAFWKDQKKEGRSYLQDRFDAMLEKRIAEDWDKK